MAGGTRGAVTRSQGNVFADLGFANPDEELAKADLVLAMGRVIEARGLDRTKAAEAIGLQEAEINLLLRGRSEGYSIDRLLAILNLLGQDVEISVRPKPAEADRAARLSVALPVV